MLLGIRVISGCVCLVSCVCFLRSPRLMLVDSLVNRNLDNGIASVSCVLSLVVFLPCMTALGLLFLGRNRNSVRWLLCTCGSMPLIVCYVVVCLV